MLQKFLNRILVLGLIMTGALPSTAQDTLEIDKSFYYRGIIGAGVGAGSFFIGSNSTLGLDLEVIVERNKTIYSIGGRSMSTFKVSTMNNYMQSYDLTIGRVLKINNLFTSLSLGIAYLEGEEWHKVEDKYQSKKYRTIGFPISVKGFLVPFRFYGIGVDLYANINSASTFYGIYACHQFGLLKKKRNQ